MQKELGYREVAARLTAAIDRGDYPPGVALPTQDELAEQYALNINTIRKAVALLHAQGLVTPTSGRGTIVRDRQRVRLPLPRYSSENQRGPWESACAQHGLEESYTEVTDVRVDVANPIVAHALGISARDSAVVVRYNRMHAVHPNASEVSTDQVYQLQETYLALPVVQDTELAIQTSPIRGGIYAGLRRIGHVPTRALEVVTSRMPTMAEADVLALGLGSPVMDIRRTTWDQDDLAVVHTHLVVSADHVSLVYPQVL